MTAGALGLLTYAMLSRMAYVLFVGLTLRRQENTGAVAFRTFRRRAAWAMNHDAVAFILLCLLTRGSWNLPVSPAISFGVGAALIILGLGVKLWAARTLGSDAYYWHNFFEPERAVGPISSGPYRFLSSPMYTVGYLQTYGLALLLRSFPGIIAAVFFQAAILAFYHLIEKPHFRRLHRSS